MGFRKPALTKDFKVYSKEDPCVDVIDEEQYQLTLDPVNLKVSPGATEFVIRPITTRQKMESYPDGDRNTVLVAYDSCEYLVRCSLKSVSNFDIGDKQLTLAFEDGMVTKASIDLMQDETLVFELAGYVRQISHLPQ